MVENEHNQAKEELLENISELFLKYGLRSTSMDDICAHLKISKKTLYQLFTNKDDVVEQVMFHRRESERVKQDMEKLMEHNSIETILLVKEHIINDFTSRLPANLFDLKKYHPDIYEKVNESGNQFIHTFLLKLLEKGIREGFLRKNINREVQVYLFVKQMSFLGEPEMISEIKYPLEIIVSSIVENVIRSLATPKGIEELEKLINNPQKTNKNKKRDKEE